MSTDTSVAHLVVTVTDEAHELPCDRRSMDCPRVALWLAEFGPYGGPDTACNCGKDTESFYCQEHADLVREVPFIYECGYCGKHQRCLRVVSIRGRR